jgi:MFS family permease
MTSRPAFTAAVLITCGVLCAALAMGLRNSFGLFLAPMTEANVWTASGFSFAIALQVLLNGISQPICGQVADRYGGRAVVMGGAVLYAIGILGMLMAAALGVFTFFAGVVMGIAVSAAGMLVDRRRRFGLRGADAFAGEGPAETSPRRGGGLRPAGAAA